MCKVYEVDFHFVNTTIYTAQSDIPDEVLWLLEICY